MILTKIISGGQTGADLAGLKAAKAFGILTGGYMPKGFRNLNGFQPQFAQEFGMTEHTASGYAARTFANVKASDGTLRIAVSFFSPGEICTLKAINTYEKPYFDVDVPTIPVGHGSALTIDCSLSVRLLVSVWDTKGWISKHNIKVLNVAGNSEKTAYGIERFVTTFLTHLFEVLQEKERNT